MAMNNVRENSATAEVKNNPHSRRIFNVKWGRLKNAIQCKRGMGIGVLQAGVMMRIDGNRWLIRLRHN